MTAADHAAPRRPGSRLVADVVPAPAPALPGLRVAPAPEAQGRGPREAAQRPSLGTYTHTPSTAGQSLTPEGSRQWFALRDKPFRKVDRKDPRQRQAARDDARAERWELRRAMRKVARSKRVQACGRPGTREDGSVVLRVTDATGTPASVGTGATGRVAGFSGLFRCGSVWLCPECSVRIAAARAAEIEQVLAHYIAAGGWAVLVTLTMRHHRGHTLADCLKGFSAGWKAVTEGRAWQTDKDVSDFAGYVRALEVTESPENGWHVHAHAILVFHSRPSDDVLDALAGGMFARWSAGVQRAGMPAPLLDYGLDVQRLDPTIAPEKLAEQSRAWAAYIAKGLAQEAALGAAKEAKGSNRTIRQLMRAALIAQRLEDPTTGTIVAAVDLTARAKLAEYEAAIVGRRQLTWSRGRHDLRAGAHLEAEKTDEEIADEELQGEDVAVIPSESWRVVEPRATDLLSVTETGGPAAAREWLDALGVEWWEPTRLTQHLGALERTPRE